MTMEQKEVRSELLYLAKALWFAFFFLICIANVCIGALYFSSFPVLKTSHCSVPACLFYYYLTVTACFSLSYN